VSASNSAATALYNYAEANSSSADATVTFAGDFYDNEIDAPGSTAIAMNNEASLLSGNSASVTFSGDNFTGNTFNTALTSGQYGLYSNVSSGAGTINYYASSVSGNAFYATTILGNGSSAYFITSASGDINFAVSQLGFTLSNTFSLLAPASYGNANMNWSVTPP
jgi:hypothetical protein